MKDDDSKKDYDNGGRSSKMPAAMGLGIVLALVMFGSVFSGNCETDREENLVSRQGPPTAVYTFGQTGQQPPSTAASATEGFRSWQTIAGERQVQVEVAQQDLKDAEARVAELEQELGALKEACEPAESS